jgi:phospholipid/cholesterol/gamma-HCH transport system ATP-binding protein
MKDSGTPAATLSPGPKRQQTHGATQLRDLTTLFTDVVDPLAAAMAAHIHAQAPQLTGTGDPAAVAATTASCTGNLLELFSIIRADLPLEATDAPPQALGYAQFLLNRGVPYEGLLSAYRLGTAMLRAVVVLELESRLADRADIDTSLKSLDPLLITYVGTVMNRLRKEFSDEASASRRPEVDDITRPDAASDAAAKTFRDGRVQAGQWLAGSPEESGAASRAREVLDTFVESVLDAATDPDLSRRLALADTTVAFVLADEPELSATLRLDRTPIEAVPGYSGNPEVTLWIASFDLGLMVEGAFKLSMGIARGRVITEGPVRKFLRVVPVLTAFSEKQPQNGASAAVRLEAPSRVTEFALEDDELDDRDESGFSGSQRGQLDAALDYQYHSGALRVTEEHAGDFWSVECIDVYKAFGKNRVLNGLNLGIPEGMITVILGPSGTGKSVLINHLIGLMFPDQGDILVHGKSVGNRRRSELFEMRREFGILFQDGALFGSMNVYDNVAFPLREQTNKSEEEIRRIVEHRLEEVGLSGAAGRTPSEISGGMKKRAGIARALVLDPKIVMFDEPDSGLDPVRTALLCELIRKVHGENGGTYIVITHDIASAKRLGDYIAVLWKGRIVESGDSEQMFNSENPFVRQFLAGSPSGPLGME